MSLYDAVLGGHMVSGIVQYRWIQVDSTEVKPNEDKVFWEIVMCPCRFPNSCKCPALMEGGGSREGASQEAGVSGRGRVCVSFTMKLNLLANNFFFFFNVFFNI